jgi:hypothetical protein
VVRTRYNRASQSASERLRAPGSGCNSQNGVYSQFVRKRPVRTI